MGMTLRSRSILLLALGSSAFPYAQTAAQATQDVRLGTLPAPMRIGADVKPPAMIHSVDPELSQPRKKGNRSVKYLSTLLWTSTACRRTCM